MRIESDIVKTTVALIALVGAFVGGLWLPRHREAADLVARTGSGVAVAPEDPPALAAAIRELRASPDRAVAMGVAGVDVAAHHSRTAAVDRWVSLIYGLRR